MAVPVILDASGRPIQRAQLTQEQAAPTTRGIRRAYGNPQASNLTPPKLARILRSAIESDPEQYLELAEDMEERDLHYASVLSTRKRQISGLDISVEDASEDPDDVAAGNLIREVIGRETFQEELIDILDALGKGFSATEIIWDTSEGQWMPSQMKFRDPRWFTFDRVDLDTLLLRGENGPEPLKPYGWLVHRAKVKSGLTIKGGLARAVAWSFLFKSFTMKDWAVFCEAYGQPLRLGKFGPDASQADKDILLDAVANIGTDYAAIVPLSMQIEFVQASITGSQDLYESRAKFLDEQVSKLVLGQTGTTDQSGSSGYAQAKVHDGVRDDIEKADAKQLAATLNRDLVRAIIDLNLGRRKKYPKIVIGRPDEVDVTALVDNVVKLIPLGFKVGAAFMGDKLGVPIPAAQEQILMPAVPIAPPIDDPAFPNKLDLVAQSAAGGRQTDSIDTAVHDIAGDGWEAMMEPLVSGLEDQLATATSEEEARAIISKQLEKMGISKLAETLARASFAARLAGETGEDL